MLKKLSIRGRLIAGFGLICLLSIVMIILGLTSTRNIRMHYMDLLNGPIATVEEIKEARMHINGVARIIRDMALDPDTSKYSQSEADANSRITTAANALDLAQRGYTANDNYMKQWVAQFSDWKNEAARIMSTLKAGKRVEAMDMLTDECTPLILQMSENAVAATNSMIEVREKEIDHITTSARSTSIIIAVLLLFTIIVLIITCVRLTGSIVTPLNRMKNSMIAMSEGDLRADCSYEGNDEVGMTVAALQSSQKTLSRLIDELDEALEEMASGNFKISLNMEFPGDFSSIKTSVQKLLARLNEVMQQLHNAGNQVSSGADQVSSGAQSLAQGATEQASSVEELSATINEISTTSKENAEIAAQVRSLANQAGVSIQKSTEQMQEMLSAMDDISSSSNEIGKIIKTIEDIAFQTNILALNAAVEAARAGTAGKGFAVVADEVRNLASKSAEASKNTAALIEQAIQAVKRGSTLATGTAQTLREASNLTHDTVKKIDHIADAVDQEASSIEQITIGIDQISAVVQTNSATSEESAAASEELSSQAQMMHSLLSYFQLEENHLPPLDGTASSSQMGASHYDDGYHYNSSVQSDTSNFDKY